MRQSSDESFESLKSEALTWGHVSISRDLVSSKIPLPGDKHHTRSSKQLSCPGSTKTIESDTIAEACCIPCHGHVYHSTHLASLREAIGLAESAIRATGELGRLATIRVTLE
jgi:hypothetical protein